MVLISGIGDQKSDSTTISASADGTKDGGRLSARGIVVQHRLRHLVDHAAARGRVHQAGNADAFAARDQQFGEREGHDQPALQLAVARLSSRQTPSTASGPATATRYARPPIPARGHRDDRRAPSAASRRSATARRRRSGGTARNFRRRRRGAVPCRPWITLAAMRRASSTRRGSDAASVRLSPSARRIAVISLVSCLVSAAINRSASSIA